MSYFSADERMERGDGLPPAPYNLRLTEVNEHSAEIGLVWQRPLGRVEGYLVLVRTTQGVQSSRFQVQSYQTPNPTLNLEDWRVALRVVGREKSGARWRVPDEIWALTGVEVTVCAFAGEMASPLSNVIALPPRLRTVTRLSGWPAIEEQRPPAPTETANQEQSRVPPVIVNGEQSRAQPSPTEDAGQRQSRAQPSPTEELSTMMSEDEAESPEPPQQLAGWAEIEAALRRNSATLGRHGLFVRRNNR